MVFQSPRPTAFTAAQSFSSSCLLHRRFVQSGGFRRASRLRGLGRLVIHRLLLLCSFLFFGRGFSIDVGHLGVRRRRLEHGHGARRQHATGREHLGARRRVEAEEHPREARGRAGCLRHTSARTVLEGCPTGRRAFVAGAGPAEPSISTYVRPRDGGRRPGGQESGHQLRHRSSSRDDAGSY